MANEKSTNVATDKSAKAATENEKLCMAIIANSQVTNIDWQGVADALGIEKIGTVQKRWSRFKAAKFGSAGGSSMAAAASSTDTTPIKKGNAAGKKRGAEEMNYGDEGKVYSASKRPQTNKKPVYKKTASPEMDEEGVEIGHGINEDADEHGNSQDGI
jgi:hypothetical protein